MQNPGHPLQEWDNGQSPLVSSDPAVVAELNGFYNVVNKALENYQKKIREVERLDKGLQKEIRAERQHKAIDEAKREMQAEIDKAMQHYQSANEEIKKQIDEAAQPVNPQSEVQQLMQYMKEQEVRRELKDMDRTERAKLLLETSKLGDRTVLQACERSLVPLVESSTLDSARNRYTEAVASDPLQRLQYAEHITQSARASAKIATTAIAGSILRQHEDIEARPGNMAKVNTDPGLSTMSAKEKASFIGKHGQDAYLRVASGQANLSDFE